jgi:hypothetical protein
MKDHHCPEYFSLAALAGGIYLVYSFERGLTDFNNIIRLHHIENLREHLLLNIQKVESDLYSRGALHAESNAALESHTTEIVNSINACFSCHHAPEVQERLEDLKHQIKQYEDSISLILTMRAEHSVFQGARECPSRR